MDENDDLTAKFGIRNIPAIFFLKDGQVVDKVVGAVTPAVVEDKIQSLL